MGDDPPYLVVGTEVSAKYKGAFCEAKIKKIVRVVKCRITYKTAGLGGALLLDDQIKGPLRVGAVVEVKHPTLLSTIEATISKIQDCSQYTVVFDDGDITTLRRSALCLKSGRHFNESETLDQLPLTHPEHFGTPVMGGRRGVVTKRSPAVTEDTTDEEDVPSPKKRKKAKTDGYEADYGKVVWVETSEKKKTKENWFPALVVSPSAQENAKIKPKEDYLVRSFKDGRYYTVPRKEATIFTKDIPAKVEMSSTVLKSAVEKATLFIGKDELPAHWDREILFSSAGRESNEEAEVSGTESPEEDANSEDRNSFIAQLYKFMDEKGTPINKVPTVCNKDLDLYKLYKVVDEKGGYTKVSSSSLWKPVTQKLGFGAMPSTSTINLIKQAYKRFLHNYEEFSKKPGSSINLAESATVPASRPRSSRNLLKQKASAKEKEPKDKKKEDEDKSTISVESEVSSPPVEVEVKPPEIPELTRRSRSRQDSITKTKGKSEADDGDKEDEPPSPAKKRKPVKEKEKDDDETSSTSVGSQGTKSVRNKSKRNTKEDIIVEDIKVAAESEDLGPTRQHISPNVKISLGDRLKVYYGPKPDGKVTYEAKVIDINDQKQQPYLVHYTGWNTRYDEWISILRISENLSLATDPVTSTPQGRGPVATSETEVDNEPTPPAGRSSPKNVARKKRTLPTDAAPSNTRSKAASIKKVSKELQITKRRVAARKVEGGPRVAGREVLVPGVESHTEKEDKEGSKEVPSKKGVGKLNENKSSLSDLNEIRSELKGLEKVVPADTEVHPAPLPNTRLDVYDFEDDLTETPGFKLFAPRSPGHKDDAHKDTDSAKQETLQEVTVKPSSDTKRGAQIDSHKVKPSTLSSKQTQHDDLVADIKEKQTKLPKLPVETQPEPEVTKDEPKVPIISQALQKQQTPVPTPNSTQSFIQTPSTKDNKSGEIKPSLLIPSVAMQILPPLLSLSEKPMVSTEASLPVLPVREQHESKDDKEPVVLIKEKTIPLLVGKGIGIGTDSKDVKLPQPAPEVKNPPLLLLNTLPIDVEKPSTILQDTLKVVAKGKRVTKRTAPKVQDPVNKRKRPQKQLEIKQQTPEPKRQKKVPQPRKPPGTASPRRVAKPPNKLMTLKPKSDLMQHVEFTPEVGPSTAFQEEAIQPPVIHIEELIEKNFEQNTSQLPETIEPTIEIELAIKEVEIEPVQLEVPEIDSNLTPQGMEASSAVAPPGQVPACEGTDSMDVNLSPKHSNPDSPAVDILPLSVIQDEIKRFEELSDSDEEDMKLSPSTTDYKFNYLPKDTKSTSNEEDTEEPGATMQTSLEKENDASLAGNDESPLVMEILSPPTISCRAKSDLFEPELDLTKEEEESCNSLLCEEEIPGSPTPDNQGSSYSHNETKPAVDASSDLDSSKVFDETKKDDSFLDMYPQKQLFEYEQLNSPDDDMNIAETSNWVREVGKHSSNMSKNGSSNSYSDRDDREPTKGPSGYADNIDNTPPASPMSSSLSSSDSGRGDDSDTEMKIDEGFKEPTDSDSLAVSSSSTDSERNAQNNDFRKDMGSAAAYMEHRMNRRIYSGQRMRRVPRRRSPDEDDNEGPMYSHRRSQIRRHHDSRIEEDFPYTPLILPPMTIPKPLKTGKYYFIPEIDEGAPQEERIEVLQNSLQGLKEKYTSIKSQLAAIERRRRRYKRREREKALALAEATGGSTDRLSPDVSDPLFPSTSSSMRNHFEVETDNLEN